VTHTTPYVRVGIPTEMVASFYFEKILCKKLQKCNTITLELTSSQRNIAIFWKFQVIFY